MGDDLYRYHVPRGYYDVKILEEDDGLYEVEVVEEYETRLYEPGMTMLVDKSHLDNHYEELNDSEEYTES